jgi:hypothetical protein
MFNCKEVSRIVSESLDRKLRLHQRIGLRMHFLMCRLCSESRRQMLFIRKTMRLYAEHLEKTESPAPLSAAARSRIKNALKQK